MIMYKPIVAIGASSTSEFRKIGDRKGQNLVAENQKWTKPKQPHR
jgi:hypothetical protein